MANALFERWKKQTVAVDDVESARQLRVTLGGATYVKLTEELRDEMGGDDVRVQVAVARLRVADGNAETNLLFFLGAFAWSKGWRMMFGRAGEGTTSRGVLIASVGPSGVRYENGTADDWHTVFDGLAHGHRRIDRSADEAYEAPAVNQVPPKRVAEKIRIVLEGVREGVVFQGGKAVKRLSEKEMGELAALTEVGRDMSSEALRRLAQLLRPCKAWCGETAREIDEDPCAPELHWVYWDEATGRGYCHRGCLERSRAVLRIEGPPVFICRNPACSTPAAPPAPPHPRGHVEGWCAACQETLLGGGTPLVVGPRA